MAGPDHLSVAVLGAGRWGKCLISTVQRLDGFSLRAVASSNPDTRTLVPDCCLVTPGWREAIEHPEVMAVLIATPPALHLEMTRHALTCGKPVFLEKPMTIEPQEAREIARLSAETGRPVIIDHIHLFSDAFRSMKEHLPQIGRIRRVQGDAGNKGPVRHDASVLWDWGPHDLAMILDITGARPHAVTACVLGQEQTRDGVGQHLRISLQFREEHPDCAFEVSNIRPAKRRHFVVEGDLGRLEYDDLLPDKLLLQLNGQPARPLALPGKLALDNALYAFRKAAHSGASADHRAMLEQGVATVDILHECAVQLSAA